MITRRFIGRSVRAISSDQSTLLVYRRWWALWSDQTGPATSLASNWDRNWSRWRRRFERTTRRHRSKHLRRQCFVKPSTRHTKLFGFGVGALTNTTRIALALRGLFTGTRSPQQLGQFLDWFDQFGPQFFFSRSGHRVGHWQ